jgi:excisionase family DNA binding protein
VTTNQLLTPAELAHQLKISVETLRYWRHKGTGPPFTKLGRHVRYDAEAVVAWLNQQHANSTIRPFVPPRTQQR